MSRPGESRHVLCPEMRLLLAACHVGPCPPAPPDGPFETGLLVRLAAFHRVSGLIYERRNQLPLPDDTIDLLQRAMLATLHRNLQLAAELKAALRALNAAGIPALLLKGAHLMDAVYGNPALRPLSDIDILIRPEHAVRAIAVLRESGYACDVRKAAFSVRADHEIRLVKSGLHEVALDLHLDLNRRTRHHWFPREVMWERSVPYAFEGQAARALCREDNLVFLCTHAVPHAFAQLVWLCDIAHLVRVSPIDAIALVDAARGAHASRATWAGLTLGKTLLGASVENATLEALKPRRAMERLLDPARLFGGTRYSTLGSLRYRAELADSNRDAAAILAASLHRKAAERLHGLTPKKAKAEG